MQIGYYCIERYGMQTITDKTFDEERALYGSVDVMALRCRFDGPADGESAFKESRGITAKECFLISAIRSGTTRALILTSAK